MWTTACLALLSLLGLSSNEVKREDAVATLGSSVLLDSEVEVNPQKQEVIWTFISRHERTVTILHHIPNYKEWLEPSEQFKLRLRFILSNGSLIINGLKAGDQGAYSLEVDNCELKVINLSLFGNLSEAVILTNSSFLDSAIWLTCNVSGDPQMYRWWKNGAEISQHHQLTDGNQSLIIMNPSVRDCGTYTCVATNPASSIQANHSLRNSGFHQEDIPIIVLSVISLVPSIFQCLQYSKLKIDKVVSWIKRWSQPLGIFPCVIILVKHIRIEGLYPVIVAVYCTISLRILTLVLLSTVQCTGCLQKRPANLGRMAAGYHLIMIIMSVVLLPLLSRPDYSGCESSFIVWSVFFGAVIIDAVVFLINFGVKLVICRRENLETKRPDLTASNEHPMLDLGKVQQSSFSDNIELQESHILEMEEESCVAEKESLVRNNMESQKNTTHLIHAEPFKLPIPST